MAYTAEQNIPNGKYISGEVWSEGEVTFSGDGGDVEVKIPTSGYLYCDVYLDYDGSGTATNSYTQFHDSTGTRVGMEYVYRNYDRAGSNTVFTGSSDSWQLFAQSQDCNQGWVLKASIPVGSRDRPHIHIDVAYTKSGVGAAWTHGSLSYPSSGTIQRIGCNIDGGGTITRMTWRVVGYR